MLALEQDNQADQAPVSIPDKRYYSDDDLCAMFDVSKRTTARWREQGIIGYMRTPGGTTIRYTRRHIAEFEKRLEHEPKGRR